MFRGCLILVALGVMVLLIPTISSADVPHMINYQGKLTSASGGCVNDTVRMTFTIYDDSLGTTDEWTETHLEVVVTDGIFNVLLGSVDSIPAAVFDGSVKYLGVQVGSDPEMTPLKPMVSVPYAYRALSADGGGASCGWVDDGTVVRLVDSTDQVGIGTQSPWPGVRLHLKGSDASLIFDPGTDTTLWYLASSIPGNEHLTLSQGDQYGWTVRARMYTNGNFVVGQTGGRMGVGEGSPKAKLDVGDSYGTGGLWGGSVAITNLTGYIDPGDVLGQLLFYGHDGDDQVGAEIRSTAMEEWLPGSSAANLSFMTTSSGASVPVERMRISDEGNVGIGTDAPAAMLHVTGGAVQVNTDQVGGYYSSIDGNEISGGMAGGAPGNHHLHIKPGDNSSYLLLAEDGGNVGVGTTSPQGALDISSTSGGFIVPRMTTAQRDALTAVNGMIIYNTSTNQFNFYENGAWVTK